MLVFSLQLNGATYKSETKFSGGGVGRNIAEGIQKLNGAVSFISAFGHDQNGEFLRRTLPREATLYSKTSDTSPTANCAVILDKHGECKLCVGDMTIHREITPDLVSTAVELSKLHEISLEIYEKFPLDLQTFIATRKSTAYLHRFKSLA